MKTGQIRPIKLKTRKLGAQQKRIKRSIEMKR
jgi:hypothetical protein